ncbi:tetratricopeptide repeat protein [bacterium]|nr:tetratricopeptide repeat protein [bacterium]
MPILLLQFLIEKSKYFFYNFAMKRLLILAFILNCTATFAAEDLSKQATAFYSDNNYQKTMDLILQIAEDERSAQDWLLLGNVLEDKGEKDNAVFMYQKAIVTDHKYYKAYYNLANYYAENNQYNMAVANYKKAASYSKENSYIFYNLACAYIKMGNLKKAKTNLNKAIMIKSDVPEYHYNLAYVYKQLGKEKLAKTYLDNYNKLTPSL